MRKAKSPKDLQRIDLDPDAPPIDEWMAEFKECKKCAELEAARFAYASEFDGDTGSIHENIRKVKAENQRLREALLLIIEQAVHRQDPQWCEDMDQEALEERG